MTGPQPRADGEDTAASFGADASLETLEGDLDLGALNDTGGGEVNGETQDKYGWSYNS